MPRSMTDGMEEAVTAELGTIVHFLEFQFAEGTVRFTTASADIAWNGATWTACGGAVGFEAVQETGDVSASGVTVTLSGVDPSLTALALTQHYMGREVRIWMAHLDPAKRTVMQDPVLLFTGFMNGEWAVHESHDDATGAGTVTLSLACIDRLARLDVPQGIQTNPESLHAIFPDDAFFDFVADLSTKKIGWGLADFGRVAHRR